MEPKIKRVRIQNIKTGKINDISQVAWDVMVKHQLNDGWMIINPDAPAPEIPAKKTRAKKLDIPAETIIEEPKSEPTNE